MPSMHPPFVRVSVLRGADFSFRALGVQPTSLEFFRLKLLASSIATQSHAPPVSHPPSFPPLRI